jgi:uncharacterized delta-60 repeat protein
MNASRILQSISLVTVAVTVFFCSAPQAHAQAGQLDPTFANKGIYATSTGKSSGNAISIQSNGKIVVAGVGLTTSQPPELADTLFRLNTNGTLDTSFGSAGVDNLEPPGATALGFYGVAIQSDGKIVALAETYNGVMVARVETNGTLDTSFGSGGFTATLPVAVGAYNTFPSALTMQPDGKIIVVAGQLNPSVMVRFDTNGQLDTAFGASGVANLAFPSPTQVAVQSNGKILVTSGVDGAGAPTPSQQAGTIVRYNSNGRIDKAFGSEGIASCLPSASALLLRSDGKIVVAGGTASKVNPPPAAGDIGFGLVRFNTNGNMDKTFGTKGVAITDFGATAPESASFALAVQSNGDIVAAGTAGVIASGVFTSSFGLSRYTSAGILDPTFGTGGEVITTLGSGQVSSVSALAIQSDGKIVAVGTSVFHIEFSNAYVARYLAQ